MRTRSTALGPWLLAAALSVAGHAATLYWDPDGNSGDGADGGSGTWSGSVWWNGSAYVAGATTDDYVVGGTAGTVTNSASKTVSTLRVSTGGYTIGTSEIVISSSATTAFTLDPGMALNLNSRIRNTGAAVGMTIGSGSTVTYGATGGIGNSGLGGAVYGGGTLVLNSGGFYLSISSTTANRITGAGTTVRAGMADPFVFGFLRVESGGTLDLSNRTQGDITGATTTTDLLGLTVTDSGSQYLGGGTASRLSIRGSTSGGSTSMGTLNVLSGATFDTGGGWVGIFSTNIDGGDLVVSGASSLALGSGKLLLGYAPGGTGTDTQAVNLTLSGGGSITGVGGGVIELTRNNAAAKTRTITVADDVAGTDFTISAAIADGVQAGSGLRKTGAGTLLLGGTNSYTGLTTVAAGTLKLSGTLATSKIAIDPGATMTGGSGTIVFSPGDVIDVNGTLDLNGMFFDFGALGAPTSPLTLLDYSGGGSILNLAGLTYTAGWTVTDTGSGLAGVVPEPGTLGLLATAGLALARRRRPRARD